jgi:hypothetical protein
MESARNSKSLTLKTATTPSGYTDLSAADVELRSSIRIWVVDGKLLNSEEILPIG